MKVAALTGARRFDAAREALRECDRIAGGRQSPQLERLDSTRGDLARLAGEFDEAVIHYTRSLTTAELRMDPRSIYRGACGLARVLARKELDGPALELAGISEAQADDLEAEGFELVGFPFDDGELERASERVGGEVAQALIAEGRAVPAGQRVKRACHLAFQASASPEALAR